MSMAYAVDVFALQLFYMMVYFFESLEHGCMVMFFCTDPRREYKPTGGSCREQGKNTLLCLIAQELSSQDKDHGIDAFGQPWSFCVVRLPNALRLHQARPI